ncbi:MAG: hypothetical protein R2771_04935 [Saprospiraceae bacterium]
MKYLFVTIFSFFLINSYAQISEDYNALIHFQNKNNTVVFILNEIENQSDISINYSPTQIKSNEQLHLTSEYYSIKDLLNLISNIDNVELVYNGNNVYLINKNKTNNDVYLSGS